MHSGLRHVMQALFKGMLHCIKWLSTIREKYRLVEDRQYQFFTCFPHRQLPGTELWFVQQKRQGGGSEARRGLAEAAALRLGLAETQVGG